MNLSKAEMNYFITQVGLSAASFGVAPADVAIVKTALNDTFNRRCSAPVAVVPSQPAQLQAICINPDCVLATNAVCAQYDVASTSGASGSASSGTGKSDGNIVFINSAVWGLLAAAIASCFGMMLVW